MAITGVRGEQIRDGEIETVDIADGAVTNAKIAAGTINADRLSFDHGGLPGLLDDDHTIYLKADGTRVATGNLTIQKATFPQLILHNTTNSDLNGARSSEITFKGNRSDGTTDVLVGLDGVHDGASLDSKGRFEVYVNDGTSTVQRLAVGSDGNVFLGGATAHGTSATNTLVMANGTAPTSSPANQVQLYAADVSASSSFHVRPEDGKVFRVGNGAVVYDGNTVWHAGNDGLGSGLDADLLDGVDGSAFALLGGRAGGQTLRGGTAASDSLKLESTSNATKGTVEIIAGATTYMKVDTDGVAYFYEGIVIEEDNLAILDIYNTTGSDADGARDAIVRFQGKLAAGTKIDQAQIRVEHDGGSANNDTRMVFLLNDGSLTEKMRLNSAGILNVGNYIGSTQMTRGVVINQGTATNEALAIASDAVNHGITDVADTDVYFAVRPESSTGTARLLGLCGSTTRTTALQLWAAGQVEDTTDTSTSRAVIELQAQKKLGSSATAIGSTGNMVVISNNGTAKWLIKGNGDTHRAGTDQGNASLDAWDDAMLARTFDLVMAPDSVIESEFDRFIRYKQEDLVKAGILSESGEMYNESQLIRLHNGAIWQLAQRIMRLENMMEAKHGT